MFTSDECESQSEIRHKPKSIEKQPKQWTYSPIFSCHNQWIATILNQLASFHAWFPKTTKLITATWKKLSISIYIIQRINLF
jgi:hypothetical protein